MCRRVSVQCCCSSVTRGQDRAPEGRRLEGQFSVGTAYLFSAQPKPTQLVWETLSMRLKRPGPQADFSPLCSVEIKNVWSYISPPYAVIAWWLINHTQISRYNPCSCLSSLTHDIPAELPGSGALLRKLAWIETNTNDLMIGVPGYRSRDPGSITGATRFPEK
jgi:hypothetical protein